MVSGLRVAERIRARRLRFARGRSECEELWYGQAVGRGRIYFGSGRGWDVPKKLARLDFQGCQGRCGRSWRGRGRGEKQSTAVDGRGPADEDRYAVRSSDTKSELMERESAGRLGERCVKEYGSERKRDGTRQSRNKIYYINTAC